MEKITENANILIVDDNNKNIQVLAKMMSNRGYRISIAQTGEEALKLVDRLKPDLILLDIMMPVMDGYETCKALKASKDHADIPVIFLTAKAEKEDTIKGFEYGAVDYVTKPFYEPELISRVSTHLEIKRARDLVRQTSEERKSLIHILCHDLMNPAGQISMILDADDETPGSLTAMKNHLRKANDNIMEIVEMVRKMTAMQEGKYTPDLQPCSLEELIQEALVIVEHRIKQKKLTINLNLNSDTTIMTEKTSFINTVFNNIMTNAIKFSYEGASIEIEQKSFPDFIELSIIDHGMGMSEGMARDIFDPREKTSRPGTNNEKGTGFGMPLVKQFVELYGGQLSVYSVQKESNQSEHGTTMKIKLPKVKG